jgi:hypothetical protein
VQTVVVKDTAIKVFPDGGAGTFSGLRVLNQGTMLLVRMLRSFSG